MAEDVSISRKQEKFLQALLLGKTIAEASKLAGIAERTGYRWLDDPTFQAERTRREAALREAEQQAIERILTTGYALMHKRVEALGELAELLRGEVFDEDKRYLPDVKSIGTGPTAERVDLIQFNGALIHEYRATFDDIAKELGHRVKKQEVTGKDGGPIQVSNPDLKHLTDDELEVLQTLAEQAQERRERGRTT